MKPQHQSLTRIAVSLSPTNVSVYADWTSVSCPLCKPLHGRYKFMTNIMTNHYGVRDFLNFLLASLFAAGYRSRYRKYRVHCIAHAQTNCTYVSYMLTPVNSKLDWNDNLDAIFEAKLTFNYAWTGLQVQSPSIVFVDAVDTIFLGMYRNLIFSF